MAAALRVTGTESDGQDAMPVDGRVASGNFALDGLTTAHNPIHNLTLSHHYSFN